ncbi:type VI secretion system baseplate subunit TssG [Piscirickettsia salmonis]|uniref:type VI secretion system baseplate subunit TssG n=1 Tax=Piscirickettsia salmonis TaxID=1238 RepID=UPI000F07CBAE|nr:hypothetical protein DA717_04455 [Piscirickettsiaceae bacterium NZ-RLO2]
MDKYQVSQLAQTILTRAKKIDLNGLCDIARLLKKNSRKNRLFFYSKPSLSNDILDIDNEKIASFGKDSLFLTANVNFFGLTNITSPLPEHYIESALADDSGNINNFFSFYSSYFFEILLKFIEKESYSLIGSINKKSYIFSYVSLISNFPQDALTVNKESFFLASLISSGKSRSAMCFFIKTVFSFESVSFDEFILSYVTLEPEFRACLGRNNATLHKDSYIGSRKKSHQSLIHINIICRNSHEFYPGSRLTCSLFNVIRQVIHSPINFEIYMLESQASCTPSILGKKTTALGWNSVLFSNESAGGKAIKKKLILKAR